jgi:type I restriction-modification system DNA methylase subunit
VYTQQECLDHAEFKAGFDKKRPENVVKINEDTYWIVEAKPKHSMLDEAKADLIYYAELMKKARTIKVSMATAVTGNDQDGYIVENYLLSYPSKGKPKLSIISYNNNPLTHFLKPEQANDILKAKSPNLCDLVIDEGDLVRIAESINETLHSASINKDERASVMASILLSLAEDSEPDYNASPKIFIKDINNRAEEMLIRHNKRSFFDHIEIKLPSKDEALAKYKTALVKTFFALKKINIKAAMRSGTDVLGKFYEVFLKYGNGAKDIGIVLTPRHIAEYFASAIDVTHEDIVYDPTCGTGGFLVSAFDLVRGKSSKDETDDFKKHRIFGIEQQPKIAALAIVNMIFRGDGKNNIIDNDCLAQILERKIVNSENSAEFKPKRQDDGQERKRPVTKVLMNPPFALKRGDEKEWHFVNHALDQMQEGGLLFSVLPLPVMLKGKQAKQWRQGLLKRHRLLAVITLPDDLFYPVGVHTCGVIIKAGQAHAKNDPVLWVRALHDGRSKKKSKRLQDSRVANDLLKFKNDITTFIAKPTERIVSIPRMIKACPIDFSDTTLELGAEAYLDDAIPTVKEYLKLLDTKIREGISYLIKTEIDRDLSDIKLSPAKPLKGLPESTLMFKKFSIKELFELSHGDFHSLDDLDQGQFRTISRNATDQGFAGMYDKPDDALIYPAGAITVATTSGDAYLQLHSFIATDNVVICFPKKKWDMEFLMFSGLAIDLTKWRYSYGRQCYKNKFAKTEIYLPVNADGEIDHSIIRKIIQSHAGWELLKAKILEQDANGIWSFWNQHGDLKNKSKLHEGNDEGGDTE